MSRRLTIGFLTFSGLLLSFLSSQPLGRSSEENRSSLPTPAAGDIDFTRDIQPLLAEKCFQCHGDGKAMGGLRLHTRADLLRGGDKGPVVELGNSASSRLIHMVGGLDEMKMPLQGDPLTDFQVGLLRSWIDRGIDWPAGDGGSADPSPKPQSGHWSFQSIQRPGVPRMERSDWVRNPIDAFVLRRLEREGIEPSSEADQATLTRRLSLDLLGLPPSPGSTTEDEVGTYAYEGHVNRLLASPHFGERWGRKWLDLARYADSDGFEKDRIRLHAWRYRDWVINTYNRDFPYDQFLVEQLAGDLLPNASIEQRVATGFHRNTLTNTEGGVDQEEYRIEQVIDRTNTTGLVFMGLTVGCAQCHSHKYDPLSHREYYELFSFFNSAVEENIPAALENDVAAYNRAKAVWEAKHDELESTAVKYREQLTQTLAQSEAGQLAEWEKRLDYKPVEWKLLDPASFSSAGGASLTKGQDSSLLVGGNNPKNDIYTVVANTELTNITAVRLDLLPHQSLPNQGPGRAEDGNFVLSELKVHDTGISDPTARVRELSFSGALASHSQESFDVSNAIDGNPETGWGVGGPLGPNRDHQVVFILKQSAGRRSGATLTLTLEHRQGQGQNIGAFQIFVTTADRKSLDQVLPQQVERALSTPPPQRTEEQLSAILSYAASQDPGLREILALVEGHKRAEPKPPDTLGQVLAANPEPPKSYIHIRGNFLRKGEEVVPNTPAVLPALSSSGSEANRLDLARWMTHPSHPLTARVEVNRLWEQLFGKGLVATSEDFGTRGERPSHPELLDWLASEFIRRGWSRKEMIRLIVGSSTYRQASWVRLELADRDPKNVLLARQGRFRVESEVTRDLYLSVGGLLNPRVGGPSVRPPLPSDIANLGYANSIKWPESQGLEKYRRGIYIFFQRTVPYPMLMTFDSPDSNTSCVRRTQSNTPLQALTLLNDPTFVECARAFGKRVVENGPGDEMGRIRYAFRLALGRSPSDREAVLLSQMLIKQKGLFEEDTENAEKLVGSYRPSVVDAPAAAAWVVAARTLMNLDEFLTRE